MNICEEPFYLAYSFQKPNRQHYLMTCLGGILHDTESYEDPHIFNPDRFLKSGDAGSTILDPTAAAFGFGRRYVSSAHSALRPYLLLTRICPGRYMAFNTIFIVTATILSMLSIEHDLDENGKPIPVKDEVEPGFFR